MTHTRTSRIPVLRRAAFTAGLGLGLLLPALAAQASSATVSDVPSAAAAQAPPTVGTKVSSGESSGLSVSARAGFANVITVALSDTTFTVRDTADTVVPGTNCSSLDAHAVQCTAFARPVKINTGDLDDVVKALLPLEVAVNAGAGNDTVTTGTGDDTMSGSDGADVLRGGFGSDRIDGGAGNDQVFGDGGNDTLVNGSSADGADILNGGAGTDVADYSSRDNRVVVDLDDVADDGEAGEKDNVRPDVEDVLGGAGNDSLTGSNVATVSNRLVGNDGTDTLAGLAGRDLMFGGAGNDALDGGAGPDELDGGPGADVIAGGPDRDEVSYSGRTAAVNISLDDKVNDGEKLEFDNVHSDVEDVVGGNAADTVVGSNAGNRIVGNGGDDFFDGGAGDDEFIGGSGFDRVSYATRTATVLADIGGDTDGVGSEKDRIGSDVEGIIGGSAKDLLSGDAADNELIGGQGDDILLGQGGNDSLRGEEGSDGLNCGDGAADKADGGSGVDQSIACETNVGVETIG